MPEPTMWERFPHDPRVGANAPLRASDRDRDVVTDVLATAYSEGRLTREELDERSDRAAAAKTLGELPSIVDDLVATSSSAIAPRDRRAEAERRYREQRRQALFQFLTPTLICWVIWLSVLIGSHGTWFPWPVFVTIGTGMRYVGLATNREDTIVGIEKDLEKKERKKLEAQQRKELGGPEHEG
jgi:hypothetical protein